MLVKIFQASGRIGIQELEEEINDWSVNKPGIKHVDTALTQVGTAELGEQYQHYVVSVWYD